MGTKETIQDDVICIGRREFSETSLILVFMSRTHGKVSVLAKGIRRARGKTAGGLDLLDQGAAGLIVSSEGLGLLREFAPGKPRLKIRENLKKWYAALYLAEVVNVSTRELEPAPALFDLLVSGIDRIDTSENIQDLTEILVRTLAQILALIGYRPELQRCVNCKREMTPSDPLFFSARGGGLVCRDCEPSMVEKIRLENRAWYFLTGKVRDVVSAGMAFDVLNYLLRETLERVPAMTAYCRPLFVKS